MKRTKLASKVIDISDDFSQVIKLLSKEEVPEQLKKADILTPEELNLLPDNDFAMIHIDTDGEILRKFPIPDESNAIVSGLYLIKTHKEMCPKGAAMAARNILNVIKDKYMGMGSFVSDLKSKLYDLSDAFPEVKGNVHRETEKDTEDKERQAVGSEIKSIKMSRAKLKDEDFAFVVKVGGAVTRRLFPIDTKENIEKAAEYFDANHRVFSLEQRNECAKAIMKKANSMGVKVKSLYLPEYSSNEWNPLVKIAIASRVERLKDMEIRLEKTADGAHHTIKTPQAYVMMVAYKKLQESAGNCDIHKFASTLHHLDKAAGLDKAYGKTITDAYRTTYCNKLAFFNSTESAKDHFDKLSTSFAGITVTAKDLLKAASDKLATIIDSDTLDEMKKAPIKIFESLPTPYKSAILDVIKSGSSIKQSEATRVNGGNGRGGAKKS